jgi:hypothetical protein
LVEVFSAKKDFSDMIYIRHFNFPIPLDGGAGPDGGESLKKLQRLDYLVFIRKPLLPSRERVRVRGKKNENLTFPHP